MRRKTEAWVNLSRQGQLFENEDLRSVDTNRFELDCVARSRLIDSFHSTPNFLLDKNSLAVIPVNSPTLVRLAFYWPAIISFLAVSFDYRQSIFIDLRIQISDLSSLLIISFMAWDRQCEIPASDISSSSSPCEIVFALPFSSSLPLSRLLTPLSRSDRSSFKCLLLRAEWGDRTEQRKGWKAMTFDPGVFNDWSRNATHWGRLIERIFSTLPYVC